MIPNVSDGSRVTIKWRVARGATGAGDSLFAAGGCAGSDYSSVLAAPKAVVNGRASKRPPMTTVAMVPLQRGL